METVEKLGKYEIKGTLGRGAMGVVYEGWDPTIQRIVAIKTIPITDADDAETQEGIARFRREACCRRTAHPPEHRVRVRLRAARRRTWPTSSWSSSTGRA